MAIGLLAILRVTSQAVLSELQWQNQRLDRLSLEQDMRQGELLRERARLTAAVRLWALAQQERMTAPARVRTFRVAALPPPHIYWELPEETVPTGVISGQQLGLASPPGPPAAASVF